MQTSAQLGVDGEIHHFLTLDQMFREAIAASINKKQTLSESKQRIDQLNLELQNLNYERFYLQNEIKKCQETHLM